MKSHKILLSTLIVATAASAVPAFATNRIEDDMVMISDGTNEFSGNTGYKGGAICANYGSVTISGGANTFTENTASSDGGAIYAYSNFTISSGTNTFTNNSARNNGGAISSDGALVEIFGGTRSQEILRPAKVARFMRTGRLCFPETAPRRRLAETRRAVLRTTLNPATPSR